MLKNNKFFPWEIVENRNRYLFIIWDSFSWKLILLIFHILSPAAMINKICILWLRLCVGWYQNLLSVVIFHHNVIVLVSCFVNQVLNSKSGKMKRPSNWSIRSKKFWQLLSLGYISFYHPFISLLHHSTSQNYTILNQF